jgi:hypothetical protein
MSTTFPGIKPKPKPKLREKKIVVRERIFAVSLQTDVGIESEGAI